VVKASIKNQVSAKEWQLRVELACAYRLVAYYGWDDFVFTHLSVRVPDEAGHFLLNPIDRMFDEITASSLVKVDTEGNNVLNTGQQINQAGFVIHSAVHGARSDAHCAIHLHAQAGQAVSAMDCGLLPLTQTAMLVTHDLAYHDYEGPAFNLEERQRLVANLGDKNLMLLRNHGTLTLGDTVPVAFMRSYLLINACEVQIKALSVGRDTLIIPPQESAAFAATANQQLYDFARNNSWPIYCRKMDKLDPSYKE
jgi:ribulose-5-phosphate 4-epimerase/fuculose-1-phosphate aldolase